MYACARSQEEQNEKMAKTVDDDDAFEKDVEDYFDLTEPEPHMYVPSNISFHVDSGLPTVLLLLSDLRLRSWSFQPCVLIAPTSL